MSDFLRSVLIALALHTGCLIIGLALFGGTP